MKHSILASDDPGERRSISRREFIASLAALSAVPAGLVAIASPAEAARSRPGCVTWSDKRPLRQLRRYQLRQLGKPC